MLVLHCPVTPLFRIRLPHVPYFPFLHPAHPRCCRAEACRPKTGLRRGEGDKRALPVRAVSANHSSLYPKIAGRPPPSFGRLQVSSGTLQAPCPALPALPVPLSIAHQERGGGRERESQHTHIKTCRAEQQLRVCVCMHVRACIWGTAGRHKCECGLARKQTWASIK